MSKNISTILLVIIFALIITIGYFDIIRHENGYEILTIKTASTTAKALVTKDLAKKELGLGNRDSLATSTVMLFVMDAPEFYEFWMKDMRFPIDIVWLDANKTVVTVKENISPDTYPQAFGPDAPSQYVIETNAFWAKKLGLDVGAEVSF